jgi:hypothetical protein
MVEKTIVVQQSLGLEACDYDDSIGIEALISIEFSKITNNAGISTLMF